MSNAGNLKTMTQGEITVYLDSNDYSVLSDPRRKTEFLDHTRLAFLNFAASGLVRFVFSGAHLSEMAPLDAKYARAATTRADLLVDLCGRHAFISFDRLIALELARLARPESPPVHALTNDGTWFPDLEGIVSPVQWADIAREIDQAIKKQGLNRSQRRTVKRQLFKSNQPLEKTRKWLDQQADAADFSDILSLYPMRPEDAKVVGRYVLGKATAKEADDALLESLRDPRWMMRWFAAHHDQLTPVTEWLRGPSRDMTARMREIAARAKDLHRYEETRGPDARASLLSANRWRVAQNELLVNIATSLIEKLHPGTSASVTVEQVDVHCPGLSTAIRSLHSSIGDAIGAEPRTPQESDFVDAIHALYAPYVTVFRADRYMAPHIRKQVAHRGTLVVPRLEELPSLLHSLIQSGNRSST
jgi:hypothetical protein